MDVIIYILFHPPAQALISVCRRLTFSEIDAGKRATRM